MQEELKQTETSSSAMAFITGLCAGAAIGAGIGLLCAPRKGSELREQVSDAATSFGQSVYKTADDFMDRGRQLYGKARDAAQKIGGDAERAVSSVAQQAGDRLESVTNEFTSDKSRPAGYRV